MDELGLEQNHLSEHWNDLLAELWGCQKRNDAGIRRGSERVGPSIRRRLAVPLVVDYDNRRKPCLLLWQPR